MARIALFDVDSKIPNLALMRLCAWHRLQGDEVEWYVALEKHNYDKIYASRIFNFSDTSMLDEKGMEIGGTGWDLHKDLPDEVEALTPDYSLYRYPHNIGFTMRGCRLRCSFCVVPEKEGKPRGNNTIEEIWTQRDSDFVVLLDNDFFGNAEWSDRIDEIKAYGLRVNFSQGLNIRNLKEDQAAALASVRFVSPSGKSRRVTFAWDDPRHEKLIRKGIDTTTRAGINGKRMTFYVLIGYHSTLEEDLHRVEVLRGFGCDPFVMPYNREDPYQRDFARWVNHKATFKSVAWEDYRSSKGQWSIPVPEGQVDLFET
jgi:hypothetical protein